jgi:hypothetical protein
MTTTRHHVLDDAEVWLSVHDASAMLGVSSATLRRWSAAGKVAAFTTPGGHRRYARSMILQLLPQPVRPDTTVSDLGESSERVTRIIARDVPAAWPGISWLEAADENTRRTLAVEGRAMVDGLLGYVDGHDRPEREDAIRPAIEAAAMHGRLAARHHGDLGETVAAFHRFRGLLVDDLAELACRRGLATQEATRILARANDGVDRLIVALVGAHADAGEAVRASR